ncbi:aspartate aminotransferase family protein [Desulfohalovibrio reitneri]|uniref:aspartate aminotransferase family protein n=1 Tax=Desulfohalovibrio reitneri TaxID=1307759 RepID=UPI0004A6B84B|nr:aspartate aminotransferase family protein [Desulfohalovibrio reitneri]
MSTPLERLKAREEAALFHTYGRYPLAVARASGSRLWDQEGGEYIDLLSGLAVTSLGHCHPEVAEAVAEQARTLVHVSNLFYQKEQVDLAERILETCHCGKVFFCNSGAEANEAAVKLARRYNRVVRETDAHQVITLEGSFHGRTLATAAATGQEKIKQGFDPLPEGFLHVPTGDLEAMEQAIGPQTAAVLVEVIQGEGGVNPLDGEYLRSVQELCRENGVLFMVDEIQTGLCRTGSFWAFQEYGLEPDVFTSAKAMANGLPMGACLATDEVARGFEPGSHATTFGGGPLLSRAALTVLDVMRRDRLDKRASDMGYRLKENLRHVSENNPGAIEEVRGRGMMLGIVLAENGQSVWRRLLDEGFVCNLTQDRVLRLLPALTIDPADLDAFAEALDTIL